MSAITPLRKTVNALKLRHAVATQTAEAATRELATAQTDYADALEAQKIAQEVARSTQAEAARPIVEIVTRCLSAVFDDPYQFEVSFESRRGKTEIDLLFRRNGHPVDPLGGAGGGVVDVAAFALRLAIMMLSRPPVQRTLILDEPFRFVSAPDRPRLRALLQQLVDELGIQIIQVTHIAELAVGNIIEIGEGEDVE